MLKYMFYFNKLYAFYTEIRPRNRRHSLFLTVIQINNVFVSLPKVSSTENVSFHVSSNA